MPRKKKNKDVINMVELDCTVHDPSAHTTPGVTFNADGTLEKGKSKSWYSNWGNKCPVCKQSANVILVQAGEINEAV